MGWKIIRLELARTPGFPGGSPSRAYLIRLPLDGEGMIDEAARSRDPKLAMVRRYWPNEPDLAGYVVHMSKGWAFSYTPGEEDGEAIFQLDRHPIRTGEHVTLTEPDGSRLPFRVSAIRDMD